MLSQKASLNENFKSAFFFKRTKEDWHPSHVLGEPEEHKNHFKYHSYLLYVSISKLSLLKKGDRIIYRVSVWGRDDFGMEKDFISFEDAKNQYIELSFVEEITKKLLLEKGFVYA